MTNFVPIQYICFL